MTVLPVAERSRRPHRGDDNAVAHRIADFAQTANLDATDLCRSRRSHLTEC
jgi:hypothetical protein